MREVTRLCGQLVLAGFHGHEASADIKRLVREFGFGGVILFARNVDAPEQLAELVRELQEAARDAGAGLSLLVAVDQEGGRVQRLRAPWTVWPPARALGRLGSEELADKESAEILVLRAYLPQEAGEADIAAAVEQAVAETGASSVKDMGKVMKAARAVLAAGGRPADGKKVNEAVKKRLAG